MAWRQLIRNTKEVPNPAAPGFFKFFSKSPSFIDDAWVHPASLSVDGSDSEFWSYRQLVKVGIPEFLNGIGKGVESHVAKLETEIGDIQKLLVTRTLKLKKLGIPCQHRKLILDYAHKYRLGLWRPRLQPVKTK